MKRIKAWVATIKKWSAMWMSGLKGWMPWITGDSPVPDHRARKVLAGTAGALVMLLIGAFLLIGGTVEPSNVDHTGATSTTTTTSTTTSTTGVPAPATAASPAVVPSTTTATTTTTAPASSSTASERQQRHRAHNRRTAKSQLVSPLTGAGH